MAGTSDGGGAGGAVGMGELGAVVRGGDAGKVERLKGGLGGVKGEGRLERWTSRRTSERLESDESSVTGLRGH